MTIEEVYTALIIQCNKDIYKSMWRCVGKIALLLLIEIALIVSGVLVNELTALQYTPIAIWCGALILAPFAYKTSQEALGKHERLKVLNEQFLANLSIAKFEEIQEREDKKE